MKFDLQKELPILIIALLPVLYLAMIWNTLPDKVPLHWNLKGEIDRWGSKSELLWIVFVITLPVYVLMTLVPAIDPKQKIEQMGGKFHQIRFLTVLFMSAIGLFILHSVKNQSMGNFNVLFVLLGLLFAVLGNFFQTIKPNYFIGIRTPWTLENDEVWKETHRFAGPLWMAGGITLVGLAFYLGSKAGTLTVIFVAVVLILAFVPILFSYLKFKELKDISQN